MDHREPLLDRFIRYVKVDTQSKEGADSYPSTGIQKDLCRLLVDDLTEAGLADAAMDEWGYVMATLPSNIPTDHPAFGRVPTVGLIAHVDTYFDVPGVNVQPVVHLDYDGGELVLRGDPSVIIRPSEHPELAACRGLTIVTSDGTTLLGADDKAGVAEILEVLWRLRADPGRLHGPVRVAFTVDEEVGRGTEHFDVQAFGAGVAYTLDGSGVGEIEDETFCADSAHVTVTGRDVHPGYAKGKLVNALRVMSDLVMLLPQHRAPETTAGREGYLHPLAAGGNVTQAKAHFLVRAFTESELGELEERLKETAAFLERKYRGARIGVDIQPSYRNMRQQVETRPEVVAYAEEAIRRAGVVPHRGYARGGTDGARLSFKGLVTPNLFNGSMSPHGRTEWVALEWMDKAVETVLHLLDVWVERSAGN